MRRVKCRQGFAPPLKATIVAPLKPTEDPAKVRQAATAFFPDARVDEQPDRLVATTADLATLRKRIWELRIIDTFRGQFLHNVRDATTILRLSKQAALAAHVSFSPTPHPLGDLQLTITAEPGDPLDIERLAWWLCPETKDGEIVGPT